MEEVLLDKNLYNRIRDFIYQNIGIALGDKKVRLVYNRLLKRLKSLGLSSIEEYWSKMENDKEFFSQEISHFIDAITTRESYFGRIETQFHLLKEVILPDIYRQGIYEFLLLSAGCSTGEEAYEMAIYTYLFQEKHPDITYRVIGVDISSEALSFAQKGIYPYRKVKRLPPEILNQFFEEREGNYVVKNLIKERVVFKRLNLLLDPLPTGLHVIFCRNVLIYFDDKSRKTVIDKFARSLFPGGYMVFGHLEGLVLHSQKDFFIKYHEGYALYQRRK